ncbi:MAG: acyltransferase domain-containing protein [Isosphaeraceae bacterium]
MMVAFLFPGQGAQVEGLLHQLPEHPEVTRTIEEASEALRLDVDALDSAHLEFIVDQVGTAESPVSISNINAPRQLVVAGSDAALDAVTAQALRQGAHHAERLAVSVPSHCPLLQPVADRLEQEMARLPLRPPSMPYVSNRGGRPLSDAEAIRQDLATGVAHPVRWYDALEVTRELGVELFIEMPPGHVSTRLVTELFRASRRSRSRIKASATRPSSPHATAMVSS